MDTYRHGGSWANRGWIIGVILSNIGCGGTPEVGSDFNSTREEGSLRKPATALVKTPPSFAFCSTEARTITPETPNESDLLEPLTDAGFFEIERTYFEYFDETNQVWKNETIAPAKLFYSFVRADHDAKSAPVFLIFNGGPGSGTTALLRSHGTAPKTLDLQSGTVVDNPVSWSSLGNLFYVDARYSGFSYSNELVESAEYGETPSAFNDQVDAMDFVRALLQLYEKYPALSDNPLVVVGESYGGVRAQLILNALRSPEDLERESNGYVDEALALALERHHSNVQKRRAASSLRPRPPADQFSWQILIQPALVRSLPVSEEGIRAEFPGACSALSARNSLVYEEERIPEYNVYKVDQTQADADLENATTYSVLLDPIGFETLLGKPPESIPDLAATSRRGSKRFDSVGQSDDPSLVEFCPTPSQRWLERLGNLEFDDCYYLPLSGFLGDVSSTSTTHGWQNGRLFLQNLREVHTFITRALLDSAVVSDFIPVVLSTYVPMEYSINPLSSDQGTAAISAVVVEVPTTEGDDRAGHIDVTYRSNDDGSGPLTRRIRFPTYRNAGHMVAQHSPTELFEDVKTFLCAPETP